MQIRQLLTVIIIQLLVLAMPARAFDIAIEDYMLPNGMRVIILPNHRVPLVTHSIWYKVGSAEEVAGKTGLAHFLEHLLFKGTAKRPFGEFDKLMTENGAINNAFTTSDHTMYFIRLPADRLELAMEIEADRMQNLVLTEANTLPERDVVKEERLQRTDSDPAGPFWEQVNAGVFGSHPYGRPVIGVMSDVAQLTKEDALSFYKTHYQPQNAVVVIAGDAKPDVVRALVAKHYGGLKNNAPAPNYSLPIVATLTTPQSFELVDERVRSPLVSLSFVVPSSAGPNRREAMALSFFADAIARSQDNRLPKELVLGSGLASSVVAYASTDQEAGGRFAVFATPNPGIGTEKLRAALTKAFSVAVQGGITKEELEQSIRRASNELIHSLDNTEDLLRWAGTAALLGYKSEEIFDIEIWKTLTVEEVNAAARKYLQMNSAVSSTLLRRAADKTGAP